MPGLRVGVDTILVLNCGSASALTIQHIALSALASYFTVEHVRRPSLPQRSYIFLADETEAISRCTGTPAEGIQVNCAKSKAQLAFGLQRGDRHLLQ